MRTITKQCVGLLGLVVTIVGTAVIADEVNFQRDVRPILAANCFTCHGPDDEARQAGLRLDESTGATADLGGYQAIDPGNRNDSELWKRLTTSDAGMRMPPTASHEPLTPLEIETLGRWIDEGAVYQRHWAFVPPQKIAIPDVTNPQQCRGPIDRMILARLEGKKLIAAPEADRYALVRRLYLDLVGLPPTPQEADGFVADQSPLAYERLVDALLASPDYAERWTRPWLDLARYADTNGYEKDRPRTIWPYRDWVLNAINVDMPFDEFSILQIAGDMLPAATDNDRIATGFHRNTMLNEEGGIDPLEYRFHAVVDRVATTGIVWLGLTTGCAQCHTHKYDPLTHTDYYSLFALLNNADEPELDADGGAMSESRKQFLDQIRTAEDTWIAANIIGDEVDQEADSPASKFRTWFADLVAKSSAWVVMQPATIESSSPTLKLLDDGSVLAAGDITKRDVYQFQFVARSPDQWEADTGVRLDKITAIRLEALPHESLPANGPGMAYYEGRRGDFFLSQIIVSSGGQPVELAAASHSYGKLSIGSGNADAANVIDSDDSTGWSTAGGEGQPHSLVINLAKPIAVDQPLEISLLFERHFAAALGRLRFSVTSNEEPAVAMVIDSGLESLLHSGLNVSQHEYARRFFQTAESVQDQYAPIAKRIARLPEAVRTLVMRQRDKNPRATFRHHRGEYLQPRESVPAAIPAVFAPLAGQLPLDRLQLAQWLVSDGNPLVGRVTVDRAWREFFGRGIVHSAGDYGTQSPPPSHPEVLDYLAIEFINSAWSMKRLHREIVLSATYRQSNHRRDEVTAIDPENRLLAVGPRRRLEFERIRDAMLAASGLLVRRQGGPSVYPPQPQSVVAMAYGNETWPPSTGGDRYRRSVYTFAKRTAPFAASTMFDGPTGELCLPRRDSSNSPLQSLTLLNDPMFVEIAAAMVEDVFRCSANAGDEVIATELFRRLLTRRPTDQELGEIISFRRALPIASGTENYNAQCWLLVARAVMNLDEAITTP